MVDIFLKCCIFDKCVASQKRMSKWISGCYEMWFVDKMKELWWRSIFYFETFNWTQSHLCCVLITLKMLFHQMFIGLHRNVNHSMKLKRSKKVWNIWCTKSGDEFDVIFLLLGTKRKFARFSPFANVKATVAACNRILQFLFYSHSIWVFLVPNFPHQHVDGHWFRHEKNQCCKTFE